MNSVGQESTSAESNVRGIVLGEAHPDCKKKWRRRRTEPDLDIAGNILSEEVMRGLMDDWILPEIVDSLIRNLVSPIVGEPR